WEAGVAEHWLGKWAMNQMLINVATRKFARSVRLPEGDVPAPAGAGLSKSAAFRRFVALSAARLKDWMTSDVAGLDLVVIQIDGIHMAEDMMRFSMMLVQASERRSCFGKQSRVTVRSSSMPSRIEPATPAQSRSRRRARLRSSFSALSASSNSQACRNTRRTEACSDLAKRSTMVRALWI